MENHNAFKSQEVKQEDLLLKCIVKKNLECAFKFVIILDY